MNSEDHYQPWKPHSSGPICIPPAHWDQRTPPSGRGHPFESKQEGFSLQCFFLAGKVIEEVKNLSLHCVQASELPIKEHCFITISCVTTLQGTHPGSTHQQNYLSQVQAVSMLLINQVCGFGLDFLACRVPVLLAPHPTCALLRKYLAVCLCLACIYYVLIQDLYLKS